MQLHHVKTDHPKYQPGATTATAALLLRHGSARPGIPCLEDRFAATHDPNRASVSREDSSPPAATGAGFAVICVARPCCCLEHSDYDRTGYQKTLTGGATKNHDAYKWFSARSSDGLHGRRKSNMKKTGGLQHGSARTWHPYTCKGSALSVLCLFRFILPYTLPCHYLLS